MMDIDRVTDYSDPETSEDPDSTQVAQEIAANCALRQLGNPLWGFNDWGAGATMSAGMKALERLIENMVQLEIKVLAKVAATSKRPYELSDKSWVYVLTNVAARRKASSTSDVESLQGYLEEKISPEMKAKLRVRLPAFAEKTDYTDVKNKPITEIVGQAYMIYEDVKISATTVWLDPRAEADAVQAALERMAERLKILDEKYGILGIYAHAGLRRLAIVDLTRQSRIFIIPVLKTLGNDIFKEFEYIYDLNGKRPHLKTAIDTTISRPRRSLPLEGVSEAYRAIIEEDPIGIGDEDEFLAAVKDDFEDKVVRVKDDSKEQFLKRAYAFARHGNLFASENFFWEAEQAGFMQTDDLGDFVATENTNGVLTKIRRRPEGQTKAQGVEETKFPETLGTPEPAVGIVASGGIGKSKMFAFNDDVASALKEQVAKEVLEAEAVLKTAKEIPDSTEPTE